MSSEQASPLILVLCTGNSCRSHMGEAILRNVFEGRVRVASAGSNPARFVHPLAIQVLNEIGLDIRTHRSKSMTEFLGENVETVITVCHDAERACPHFPGQVHRHHWPFDDPARATGTEQEILAAFRRVRDEIRRVFEAYACGRMDQMQSAGNSSQHTDAKGREVLPER